MDLLYTDRFVDKEQNERTPLYLNNYLKSVEFQPVQAQTNNLLLDTSISSMSEPYNWSSRVRLPIEGDEASTNESLLAALNNTVINESLVSGGVDPSKRLIITSMLNLPSFREVLLPRNEISEDLYVVKSLGLGDLLKSATEEELKQPEAIKVIQKQRDELAYMRYVLDTPRQTGTDTFTYPKYSKLTGSWAGDLVSFASQQLISNYSMVKDVLGIEPAPKANINTGFSLGVWDFFPEYEPVKAIRSYTDNVYLGDKADLVKLLNKKDDNFNHIRWFNDTVALNDTVRNGLLDLDITADSFYGIENQNAAMFKLQTIINKTNIENKLQSYDPGRSFISPRWYAKELQSFGRMFANNLDTPVIIGADIAKSLITKAVVGSAVPVYGTAAGVAVGVAEVGIGATEVLSRVVSTAWHVGFGGLPKYAQTWGIIRPTLWHFGQGAAFMTVHNTVAQNNNLAFANSVYGLNPEVATNFNSKEVLHSALVGGLFGAGLHLGMAGIGEGFRRMFNPTSLSAIEKSKKNINEFFNRKDIALVDPNFDTVNKAVLAGKEPTPEGLNANLRKQAEGVEVNNGLRDDINNSPIHPNSRIAKGESIDSFVLRTASSEVLTSPLLALDAVSEGGRYNALTPSQKIIAIDKAIILTDNIASIERGKNTSPIQPSITRVEDSPLFLTRPEEKTTPILLERPVLSREEIHADIKSQLAGEKIKLETQNRVERISSVSEKARKDAISILDAATGSRNNPEQAKAPLDVSSSTPEKVQTITVAIAKDLQSTPDNVVASAEKRLSLLDDIEKMLSGTGVVATIKRIALGKLKGRALTKAQRAAQISVLESPSSFLTHAEGYVDVVKAHYDQIQTLVDSGLISEADRNFILAATVTLRFDRRMSITPGERSQINNVTGEITIGNLMKYKNLTRVKIVAHEIGHAYELYATGTSLFRLRRLFKDMPNLRAELIEVAGATKENVNYTTSNTAELFAEVFSNLLVNEVAYSLFLSKLGKNKGVIQAALLEMVGNIAADVMQLYERLSASKAIHESTVYEIVKNVIHELEQSSKPLLRRQQIVDTVLAAVKKVEKEELKSVLFTTNSKEVLADLNSKLKDFIGEITHEEFQLLNRLFKDDIYAIDALINTKLEGDSFYFGRKYSKETLIEKARTLLDKTVGNYGFSTKPRTFEMKNNNRDALFMERFKENYEVTLKYLTNIEGEFMLALQRNGLETKKYNDLLLPGMTWEEKMIVLVKAVDEDPDAAVRQQPTLDPLLSLTYVEKGIFHKGRKQVFFNAPKEALDDGDESYVFTNYISSEVESKNILEGVKNDFKSLGVSLTNESVSRTLKDLLLNSAERHDSNLSVPVIATLRELEQGHGYITYADLKEAFTLKENSSNESVVTNTYLSYFLNTPNMVNFVSNNTYFSPANLIKILETDTKINTQLNIVYANNPSTIQLTTVNNALKEINSGILYQYSPLKDNLGIASNGNIKKLIKDGVELEGFSVNNPNLKKLSKLFIEDGKNLDVLYILDTGEEFVSADYSLVSEAYAAEVLGSDRILPSYIKGIPETFGGRSDTFGAIRSDDFESSFESSIKDNVFKTPKNKNEVFSILGRMYEISKMTKEDGSQALTKKQFIDLLNKSIGLSKEMQVTLNDLTSLEDIGSLVLQKVSEDAWVVSPEGLTTTINEVNKLSSPKTISTVTRINMGLNKALKEIAGDVIEPITESAALEILKDVSLETKVRESLRSKLSSTILDSQNFSDAFNDSVGNFFMKLQRIIKDTEGQFIDKERFLNRLRKSVFDKLMDDGKKDIKLRSSGINKTNWEDFKKTQNEIIVEANKKRTEQVPLITESFQEAVKSKGDSFKQFSKEYSRSKNTGNLGVVDSKIQAVVDESLIVSSIGGSSLRTDAKSQSVKSLLGDALGLIEFSSFKSEKDLYIKQLIVAGKTYDEISTAGTLRFGSGFSVGNIKKRVRLMLEDTAKEKLPEGMLESYTNGKTPTRNQLAAMATAMEDSSLSFDQTTPAPKTPKSILTSVIKKQKAKVVETNIEDIVNESTSASTIEKTKDVAVPIGNLKNTGEVTQAVVLTTGNVVGDLTPSIPLGVAEKLLGTKEVEAVVTVAIPQKSSRQLVGSLTNDSYYSAGNLDGRTHPVLQNIERVLNSIDKPFKFFDREDLLNQVRILLRQEKEEEAVTLFKEVMQKEEIDGVTIMLLSRKNQAYGVTYVFDKMKWQYGSYVTFESSPKKPATVVPDTAVAPDGVSTIPVARPIVKPKSPQKIEGGSVVPTVSTIDKITLMLTEGNDGLRDNGTDGSTFRVLLKAFNKATGNKEISDIALIITDSFKVMWGDFVMLNAKIMEMNRIRFGSEDVVSMFWVAVDKIKASEEALTVSVKGKTKYKSTSQIYREAATVVTEQSSYSPQQFYPPISEDAIRITLDKEGKPLVKLHRDTSKVLELLSKYENKLEAKPTEVRKAAELSENVNKDSPIDKSTVAKDETQLLIDVIDDRAVRSVRQNNWISFFFGGDERANRNWWRALMSNTQNVIQHKQQAGDTFRSLIKVVSFLSHLFDDTRVVTSTLVAPNSAPLRSVLRSVNEIKSSIIHLRRLSDRIEETLNKLGKISYQNNVAWLYIEMFRAGKDVSIGDLKTTLKTTADTAEVKTLVNLLSLLREEQIIRNKQIFGLERKTKWISPDLTDGDPLTHFPVQIDSNKLREMTPTDREILLKAWEKARVISKTRKNKGSSDMPLDTNTLIVMGILDIENVNTLFTRDRILADAGKTTPLNAASLKNLFITEHSLTTWQNTVASLKAQIRKQYNDSVFTITEGDTVRVYRNPENLFDLSPEDRDLYLSVVRGDNANMLPKWQAYLKNETLTLREMSELLDYKANSGRYRRDSGKLINGRPDIAPNDDPRVQTTVQNLTPEEVMSDPTIKAYVRNDIRAIYQLWLFNRGVDLKVLETFQSIPGLEITTKPVDVLIELENIAKDGIKNSQQLSVKQKEFLYTSLKEGMTRLYWLYAEANGTLPSNISAGGMISDNLAKSARSMIALQGIVWGKSSLPEVLIEIVKNSKDGYGLSVPIRTIQVILNLLKVWDRKNPAIKFQVDDLATALEDQQRDHTHAWTNGDNSESNTAFGGVSYGSIWNSKEVATGPLSGVTNFLSKGSKFALMIGSLQGNTQFVRSLGKTRFVGGFNKFLTGSKNGKLVSWLTEWADVANREEMDGLRIESYTEVVAEKKLTRKFKEIARRNGINEFEAIKLVMVGITSLERANALAWGLKKLGALHNRLDFVELSNLTNDLRKMEKPPIDPDLYYDVVSQYKYGIENLIRKRVSSYGFGLNKVENVQSFTETGKLTNALTNWMRAWHDNTVLNAAERGTVGLLVGGLVYAATAEIITKLLLDWSNGRSMEDIIEELKKDPTSLIVRTASRLPLIGSFQPVLQAMMNATFSTAKGGVSKGIQSVVDSTNFGGIGQSSLSNNLATAAKGVSKMVNGEVLQGVTDVAQSIVPYNRSPLSFPARVFEELADLDDKSAFMEFQNLVQMKSNPYAYSQGARANGVSKPSVSTTPINVEKPLDISKARQIEEERSRNLDKITPQLPKSAFKPKGVSPLLADLLSKTSKKHQSWGL